MEITQNNFQTDIKLGEGEVLPESYVGIEECNVSLDLTECSISLDLKLSEEEARMLSNGIQLKYKVKDIPAIGPASVSIVIDKESTYGSK